MDDIYLVLSLIPSLYMKKRILFLLTLYFMWLPLLAIQKPVFMLYHHALASGCSLIDHDTFTFSRNILSPDYPEYAFYTYSNGFGFIDSTGISVYDNEGNKPLIEAPRKGSDLRLRKGKALLQTLYDDLGNR